MLVILRAIQGIGAAVAMPASVSGYYTSRIGYNVIYPLPQLGILARSFPLSRARSIAFATFAAGAPIGAAFGTVFGGLLAQTSG